MAVKTFKPTTPSRRNMSVPSFDEVTKSTPEKSLIVTKKKHAGRNSYGKITVRHHGGGNKQKYRIIDFKRNTEGAAKVIGVEYDPNRTAYIALLENEAGKKISSYPAGWWLGLLGLIVFGALLLWKFPRWQRSPQGAVAAVLVVALAIGGAIALPEWVFYCDYQALQDGSEADRLAAGDYGRMQSAEAAYENLFNAHRLYQVCGLNQMLCKDLYTHVIYPMTPSYLVAQKEAKGQIGQYLTDHASNDMTGLLEGKDVILVLMESMDDWMIGEHTPTLEKLMNTYIELSAQKIKGENITKTLTGIEAILDTIEPAFERQLDNLYEDQAIDISADITVLEGMLDSEGLGRTATDL